MKIFFVFLVEEEALSLANLNIVAKYDIDEGWILVYTLKVNMSVALCPQNYTSNKVITNTNFGNALG